MNLTEEQKAEIVEFAVKELRYAKFSRLEAYNQGDNQEAQYHRGEYNGMSMFLEFLIGPKEAKEVYEKSSKRT